MGLATAFCSIQVTREVEGPDQNEATVPSIKIEPVRLLSMLKERTWSQEVLKIPFYHKLPSLAQGTQLASHPPAKQLGHQRLEDISQKVPSRFASSGKSYTCPKHLARLHGRPEL